MQFTRNQALDNAQLMALAPSIFADHAQVNVSERYEFMPTIQVIEALRAEGWMPVFAHQQRVNKVERQGFQQHMMRFRRAEDLTTQALQVGDTFTELVMRNAHDRTKPYSLNAGVFRLACSNGMIVSDGSFDQISVKHIGNTLSDVIEASYRVLEAVPQISAGVNEMKQIILSSADQKAFAESALIVKYDSIEAAPISAEKLLAPRRYEDTKKDLWSTLNVVQENIVRGGLKDRTKVNAEGKAFKRTSALRSIDENVKVNKALWHLADALKQMKAA